MAALFPCLLRGGAGQWSEFEPRPTTMGGAWAGQIARGVSDRSR